MNYIVSANINFHNGTFNETVRFTPGLNFISGENGTMKTKLLQFLKSPGGMNFQPGQPLRVMAISPKRNSERKSIETAIQYLRTQNKNFDSMMAESDMSPINDQTFQTYPSVADLFYAVYQKKAKDGHDRTVHMNDVTIDFNSVISNVFNEYEFISSWNADSGEPNVSIRKNGVTNISLDSLSLGEQEVLSLILNLHVSKNQYNVYLIDEPELHLNWYLEEKLFNYFNEFCETNNKQIITVTHSRAIFKPVFLNKAQFLYWEQGSIKVSQELTDIQRTRIAGEAIEIIKLGSFSRTTFFVEDSSHLMFLTALSEVLDSPHFSISECGNSVNVKSLYKLSKAEVGWEKAFFVIDGDNQGNPFPNEQRFIHLDKYCIENYLLDFEVCSKMLEISEGDFKKMLIKIIREKRNDILKNNKYLDFLLDRLQEVDLNPDLLGKFDGSLLVEGILKEKDIHKRNYVDRYLKLANEMGRLEQILPEKLLRCISVSNKELIIQV